MKKYKLIERYPGSPAIGTISKPIKSIHDDNHYWCGVWFNPANYPKYWEEVVEKDYEILSFKGSKTFKILTLRKNGNYFVKDSDLFNPEGFYNGQSLEYHLNHQDYSIHSVKRLSDNTVFTVGDKTNRGTIEKISVVDNNICINQYINSFKDLHHLNYEILSLKYMNNIYDRFDGKFWFNSKYKDIKSDIANRININSLNTSGVMIHSVKRLSDGEVFTVGDNVEWVNGRIVDIIINSSNKCLFSVTGCEVRKDLEVINHFKKPLFTTEDGFEIFEGDYWYYVKEGSDKVIHTNVFKYEGLPQNKKPVKRFSSKESALKYIKVNTVLFVTEDGVDIYMNDKYHSVNTINWTFTKIPYINPAWSNPTGVILYFSTKEKAEEYILFNKPCLSLNDVAQFYSSAVNGKSTNSKNIINFVKSKL